MNKKNIEQILKLKNVKPTAMRMLVLEYFQTTTSAISLRQIEFHFDHSDMSTLYRTLKTFVEHNILHTIDDGSGTIKYAKCIEGCICAPEDLHYHFHCLNCKKTICLTKQNIPSVNLPENFTMSEANMVVKGHCSDCQS
ncbi:MAG: transcriptional repressor [Fluviicola sp.]|nr:transcriptional repressor [Fluviicola sp.]